MRWSRWIVALLAVASLGSSLLAQSAAPPAAKEITDALQPFVERQALAGAVTLVANKDRVLSVNTVGFSDVGAKTAIQPDALFWIASMSKPITGAAIMILVDEKKISLDDPVAKYLPEFRDVWVAAERDNKHILLRRPSRPMTIRDVMCHVSGLPFKSNLETPTLDTLKLEDTVRGYAMTPLDQDPGTKSVYSNAGINTAGRIVEVVSKMPFEKFLDEKLFAPTGMTDTTFWPNESQLKRLAHSYKPTADKKGLEETTITALRYPLTDKTRQPMPGGGLFSTAADMGRFGRMVLAGGTIDGKKVLSPEAVAAMTSKQTPPDIKVGYGVGWAVNGDVVGHGGAYSTNLSVDRKNKLVTVFLVQHAGFPNDGNMAMPAFQKAAVAKFASP